MQGSRQENIYSDFQKSSFLSYTHVRYLKRKLSTTVLQKSSKMFGFYIHKLGKQARMGFLASNGDAGNWTFLKSFRGFFGRFFGKYLGKFWGKFLRILWAIWIQKGIDLFVKILIFVKILSEWRRKTKFRYLKMRFSS